jgi:hypothetical protein
VPLLAPQCPSRLKQLQHYHRAPPVPRPQAPRSSVDTREHRPPEYQAPPQSQALHPEQHAAGTRAVRRYYIMQAPRTATVQHLCSRALLSANLSGAQVHLISTLLLGPAPSSHRVRVLRITALLSSALLLSSLRAHTFARACPQTLANKYRSRVQGVVPPRFVD